MDALTGFLLGCVFSVSVVAILAAMRYIDKTSAWDHCPTDEEISQRIIEGFILDKEEK